MKERQYIIQSSDHNTGKGESQKCDVDSNLK